MQYKFLKPGDVRQKGDEVRHKFGYANSLYVGEPNFLNEDRTGLFRPCTLLGHLVLPGDLVATEIRRALP